MQILQVLHANKIPLSGAIDIRSIPAVRRQVMDIVRRAGGAAPASAPEVIAPPPAVTVAAPMPLTVSQRLQELETLHATGTITDDEYGVKRREILADL
jgi:hypothetical protein